MAMIFYSTLIAWSTVSLSFQNSSVIEWNASRRLTWNDFKAAPPKNPSAAALTSTAIKIEFGYYNESLQFHIRCRFDKEASWGKVMNDYVLAHEQGHFDIAEIFARKLNEALKNYKPDNENVRTDVNKIYQDLMKQYYEQQDEYDRETNYSIDHKKQKEWLQKIADELSSLKDNANYH